MNKFELLEEISKGGCALGDMKAALEDGAVLKAAFGLKDWNPDEEERPAEDIAAEAVAEEAHEIVLALIEEYGEDFPVSPYMASCSKALEHAEFDDEEDARKWVEDMNARFPVGYHDAESDAYYMNWEQFAASVGMK